MTRSTSAKRNKNAHVEQPPNGWPQNGSQPIIEVAGLRKLYGDHVALAGINLQVQSGEIVAMLGPNGAGKTTLIEILEGYRTRTSGRVSVLGEDPSRAGSAWRSRIGVVLQESAPERDLSVAECVALYAGYYPNPRPVSEVLELVGLVDQATVMVGRMSGGQQRRLDVGLALVGRPDLIFLDEPTTGFDPSARRMAWEMIDGLRRLGTTIVLTTHYMEEAERLADRIAVVAKGRIVATGTPDTIAGRLNAPAEISFSLPVGLPADDLPGIFGAYVSADARKVKVSSPSPLDLLAVLARWADDRSVALPDLEVRHPSLEDVYLQLTTDQGEAR